MKKEIRSEAKSKTRISIYLANQRRLNCQEVKDKGFKKN